MLFRIVALFALSASALHIENSKVLTLRGGMDLGPINADNFGGALKVAGAITAAGAITEKYAGMGETTLTKMFSGEVWTTNVIIAIVTGVVTNVLYSVGASGFDTGKLGSALWMIGLLSKLKDSPDVATITGNPVESVIAIVATLLAWA